MIFGILAILIGVLMLNAVRRGLFRAPHDPRSPRQRKTRHP